MLVSAICVLGCSNEVLDVLQPHGGCPLHSKTSSKTSPHECFHKALTSAHEAGIAPSLDLAFSSVQPAAIARVLELPIEIFPPALSPPGLTSSILVLRI